MNLIFIHGRSQGGQDQTQLKEIWVNTWKDGLRAAELEFPHEWTIHFPYYGDLLDALVQQEDAPVGAKPRGAQPSGNLRPGLLTFEAEVLGEMAVKHGADPNTFFDGQPKERGVGSWEWVQAILRALDAHTSFGSASVERFTRDVYYYLTLPHIRSKIDDTVRNTITAGPCVVVGHSLGSIVGYNVLHSLPKNLEVRRYITVGSPLGVHAIRDRLDQPLKTPACLMDWFNAMDTRDIVALRPLTSSDFNVEPEIRNKTTVDNQTDNHHGIIGYLNDSDVAREIRSA
jgi:hypothetical protein